MDPAKFEELLDKKLGAILDKKLGEKMELSLEPFRKKQEEALARLVSGGGTRESIEAKGGTIDPITGVQKGDRFGRLLIAAAAMKRDQMSRESVQEFVMKRWNDKVVADAFSDTTQKALAATTGVAGGFAVPLPLSDELIEFLRPASVVRRAQARVLGVPAGRLNMSAIVGGAVAGYVGENNNAASTQQQFGQIQFNYKKLTALIPISNDFIRYAISGAETGVREDAVAAIAQREDLAFIRDDGTSNNPKGMRYQVDSANVIVANATVNLANTATDAGKMWRALVEANTRMVRPCWLWAPRTEEYLYDVQNSLGLFPFRDGLDRGVFRGLPRYVSNQIPINLGGGGNESEIYLADMVDMVIGDSLNMQVDVSMDAAYDTGSGLVSAFQQDQTVVRIISEHDFQVRHTKSVAVMTTVKWGA